jgi:N-acetylmuramoyl-L-alanine amidase
VTKSVVCIDRPSPNHGDRRGRSPDMVVLHYTAMDTAQAAAARLCDPAAEVSAHWLIGRDGALWRLVAEDRRAWHAGRGGWAGETDVNSRSIGVELDNTGDAPFSAAQMRAVETLLAAALRRWSIPPERVIGHACMAPDRKADPGPRFDWRRLARRGLAVWLDPPERDGGGPADPAAFRTAACRFGYPLAADGGWDDAALAVARAFADRFAPGRLPADAPPGAALAAHLARLADRWPASTMIATRAAAEG